MLRRTNGRFKMSGMHYDSPADMPSGMKRIYEHQTGERAPKPQKYHNIPDKRGKIKFKSQKEALRFDELMWLLSIEKIRNLKLQPEFTLQAAYTTPDGDRVRAIRYIADFSYERPTAPDTNGVVYWMPVVEDVKSKATATPVYRLKKKLMKERLNIDIMEV
jgi:hypothetical protein